MTAIEGSFLPSSSADIQYAELLAIVSCVTVFFIIKYVSNNLAVSKDGFITGNSQSNSVLTQENYLLPAKNGSAQLTVLCQIGLVISILS